MAAILISNANEKSKRWSYLEEFAKYPDEIHILGRTRFTNQDIKVQWTLLNKATSGQAKMAIITGWIYYPEFLFNKKSKFLLKSGHINRLDILSVDILRGSTVVINFNFSLLIPIDWLTDWLIDWFSAPVTLTRIARR